MLDLISGTRGRIRPRTGCSLARFVNRLVVVSALSASAPHGSLKSQTTPLSGVGPVRAMARETGWDRQRKTPTIVLTVETVREFGCTDFTIKHSLSWRADTLRIAMTGIGSTGGLCATGIGPARMTRELRSRPGRYTILMTQGTSRDQLELAVTDSSFVLTRINARRVEVDDRLWWRYPPQSLSLSCENVVVAKVVCDDVGRWLAGQPGVRELKFASEGVNPYRPDSSQSDERVVSTFRYADDAVLDVIRQCVAEIGDQIRWGVGVFVSIGTWKGEHISAYSTQSYHESHIPLPRSVTAGPRCSAVRK